MAAALFLTCSCVFLLAPRGFVVRTLIGRLESVTGFKVIADDVVLDWHATPMTFTAGAFTVIGTEGNILLTARALHCTIDARGLLGGRIAVNDIDVVEPHLALTVVNGVIVGVPLPEPHHHSLIRIDVDRVRARRGTFEIALPQEPNAEGVIRRPVTIKLRGVDVDAVPDGTREHRVVVSVRAVALLRADETMLTSGPVAVELWAGGDTLLAIDRLTLPDVAVSLGDNDVVVSGVVNLPIEKRAGAVDVDVRGRASLAFVGPMADVKQLFAGTASVTARATAEKRGVIFVDADASVDDLVVDKMSLGDIAGHLHAEDSRASLTGATWQIGDTVLRGEARGVLGGPAPFHVDAAGERFSLYHLFRALRFSDGPWVETRVAGPVSAEGTLFPFALAGHGAGVVDDIAVAAEDVKRTPRQDRVLTATRPVHCDIDFHVDQTSLRFSRGAVDDGITKATGALELFVNQSHGLVLDVVAPALSMTSVGERVGSLALRADASGELHVRGPYAHPLVHARVHARDLVVDGFALGDGDGRIEAAPDALTLRDVVLHKGRSQYRANLLLSFAHPAAPGVRPPWVRLDVALEGARAEDLRAIIPAREKDGAIAGLRSVALTGPVAGDVHARGWAGGAVHHLDADATLTTGDGARLYGANVAHRALHVGVHGGRVHVGGLPRP